MIPRSSVRSLSGQRFCLLTIQLYLVSLCLLLLLVVCAQAHIGRIYKSARTMDRSEGRKFPILRALVSQFISERSSRDITPAASSRTEQPETKTTVSEPKPANSEHQRTASSKSKNNVKTIQHIIEDINSQNSKISTKRRKHFLVNILSRMLKSVNFTEVNCYSYSVDIQFLSSRDPHYNHC